MPEPGESPARALRERGLRPRKRLGQNFLRDRAILDRIVAAADVGPDDAVLEIGSGTGSLTAALAARAGRVVTVELDDNLFALLEAEFASMPNVELIHADALSLDPCSVFAGAYKLVANIPYYITGPIVRHFLESRCPPGVMVLMVQREVGLRMTAKPGDLSLLGVSVQWYAEPEIMTRVPAGAFYPPPNVDSVVVRLRPRHLPERARLTEPFFEVARAGFSTRRKQLVNAISRGLSIDRDRAIRLLTEAGIEPSRRAETLSLDEWERLAGVWVRMG
ncbi:MAG TPA: 16S rRNA (adenine(1518)-N(6)/adenine(1519)-N(6))-dimethyltransferase RsmA [Chloroflexota bacterium]|nr:16S rRNA (adenine(1518)-N(6)/adenine(1519)-N(6))-dimethyltransferase RsmA [Chloroflexota bacterium]